MFIIFFPRRNDNKIPDLNNDIIGFDRGYNCFLLIISYILKCVGHKFGTSKSDIHKIFAYDLRKRQWDKKMFREKYVLYYMPL